jgi:hypothetical protein
VREVQTRIGILELRISHLRKRLGCPTPTLLIT